MNTTYILTCQICRVAIEDEDTEADNIESIRDKYIGCTGRSLHARMTEHTDDIKNRQKKKKVKGAMAKHFTLHHDDTHTRDVTNSIETVIVARHSITLNRVIDESLRLEKEPGLTNSKGDWGRGGGLVRLVAVRTQDNYRCDQSQILDPG